MTLWHLEIKLSGDWQTGRTPTKRIYRGIRLYRWRNGKLLYDMSVIMVNQDTLPVVQQHGIPTGRGFDWNCAIVSGLATSYALLFHEFHFDGVEYAEELASASFRRFYAHIVIALPGDHYP